MKRATRLLGAALSAGALALAGTGKAAAEPVDSAVEAGHESSSAAGYPGAMPDAGDPVSQACDQFDAAISLAAVNYEEFAYATAGGGNIVDYRDPNVQRTNVIGRAALRESAAAALSASRTPGLPPTVSDPIRAWSLHATKLLVVMGLRGGGDTLNSSAEQLNADATEAQFACASARG